MAQIDQSPQGAGPVLHRAKIHWVCLLGPSTLFIIGAIAFSIRPVAALVMVSAGLIWGIVSVCNVLFSELTVTETNLTVKIGSPFQRVHQFPYATITYADIEQPPLGTVLRYGKVIIAQTDGRWMAFNTVANPGEFIARLRQGLMRFGNENVSSGRSGAA